MNRLGAETSTQSSFSCPRITALAEPSAGASSLSKTPPVLGGSGAGGPTGGRGGAAPAGYLEAPPRCPYSPARGLVEPQTSNPVSSGDGSTCSGELPTAIDHDGESYRIVGFRKLRDLLQPRHAYFKDSAGFVEEFSRYDGGGGLHLCYPRIKVPGGSGKNPYRKTQLRSKHTARTIKKLLALRESAKLEDFKVAVVITTFPKEMSEWFSRQKGDTGMAWRIFNHFWNEDFLTLDDDSEGQAAYVNLHKWKTEEPVKPHYHFHSTIPNYRLAEILDVQDEQGNNALEFKRKRWHLQRGGNEVPFSDGALEELKIRWHSRLVKFATRHGIREMVPDDWRAIDLFVEYVAWDSDIGKAKLMNKLNYQSRHWLEDYAVYSNKNPDCELPPAWLEGYNNASRTFGWWKHLKSLTVGVELAKEEKLSPLTGEVMEREGNIGVEGLLWVTGGNVGTLEFYKGTPVWGHLSPGDISWLRSVMWSPGKVELEVENDGEAV